MFPFGGSEDFRELHKIPPVTLRSGRTVCGPHRLDTCPVCCLDFSYMNEEIEGAEDEDDDGSEHLDEISDDMDERMDDTADSEDASWTFWRDQDSKDTRALRVGTGRVLPGRFIPPRPQDTSSALFPPGISLRGMPRFINRTNISECLIYTDGACLNNGSVDPRAGCSFVFREPFEASKNHCCRFTLEAKGPGGEEFRQTSNRAELRAVIGALRFRHWGGEGFESLVIATDSEYVVEGATSWVKNWLRN